MGAIQKSAALFVWACIWCGHDGGVLGRSMWVVFFCNMSAFYWVTLELIIIGYIASDYETIGIVDFVDWKRRGPLTMS